MEEKIKELIKKPLEDINLQVDDVIYTKEHNNMFLRIILTNDTVVDLDMCVLATRIIDELLDEYDLIDESYILDVCSKEKEGN